MTDIAAHLATGAAPRIAFTELAPAHRSAAPAPLCVFGPAGAALNQELFGQTHLGAVGCYAIEHATLAPTGIAIKDGVAFSSAAFIHPPHHVATVAGRLLAADLPVRHVRGPLAVIYGPGHETYGHWLVDFLPRLWVLAQAGHDVLTLRYAIPPDLKPFAARLLARAGVRESQLVPYRYWHETLRTDLLLMPTGLRTHNRMSPLLAQATAFWTAGLRRAAGGLASLGQRIFVSRAHAPSARTLTNRAAIEAIAAARGFAVFHPQTMDLAAQVAAFAGARIIAGEYGSALHGSVYAGAGAVTVGLRGNLPHPSFVQSGVADALGQRAAYVLGQTEGQVEQSFSVLPEEFERGLDVADVAASKEGLLF